MRHAGKPRTVGEEIGNRGQGKPERGMRSAETAEIGGRGRIAEPSLKKLTGQGEFE